VKRLISSIGRDDTRFDFEEQLKRRRMKIEYGGKPYNCTKYGYVGGETTVCEVRKIINVLW
jgi:hypothetical protein